jgi:hypothetical protein
MQNYLNTTADIFLYTTGAFTKHQKSGGHLHAAEAYSAWLKQVPIDQQINEQAKMQESASRQIEKVTNPFLAFYHLG